MNERTTCKARRVNDEMHCSQCGFQWDIDDTDPPQCKEVGTIKPVDHMSNIREMLEEEK